MRRSRRLQKAIRHSNVGEGEGGNVSLPDAASGPLHGKPMWAAETSVVSQGKKNAAWLIDQTTVRICTKTSGG